MKYYCDGYTLDSNPSKIGGGYSIVDESGKLIDHKVINKEGFTNNEAELEGILATLELTSDSDAISTDSMCMLTWVNSGMSKARPELNPTLKRCQFLKEQKKVNLMWEARQFNLAGHFNEKHDTAMVRVIKDRARVALRTSKKKSTLREKIRVILESGSDLEDVIEEIMELTYPAFNNNLLVEKHARTRELLR